MNKKRIRKLNKKDYSSGPVIYWMDRERRMRDNWAFVCAQKCAKQWEVPMAVVYVLPETFLDSAWRQHHFMIEGFKELIKDLEEKNIPFYMLLGDPEKEINKFVEDNEVGCVVTDFTPLKLPRSWRDKLEKSLDVPFYEVDARNVVPVWEASPKQEYGAYTIRPKIHKKLDEFLDDFPNVRKIKEKWKGKVPKIDWKEVEDFLKVDKKVESVDWLKPGERAASKVLSDFLSNKSEDYSEKRNDPNADVLSDLSPYLHFGHISAQKVALMAQGHETFLEELIVRRELAENYCFYNEDYDSFEGFPDWAKKTLEEHRKDQREYNYSLKEFEEAKTHQDLWNAAQMQMVKSGKMHGYMRMYWCKKIFEWTKSPEEAMEIAIYLNDKYELDGRDPNGYVGVAWSIGGVHDRAWTERDIFGKIRYMNLNGCKRKFDVQRYIDEWL